MRIGVRLRIGIRIATGPRGAGVFDLRYAEGSRIHGDGDGILFTVDGIAITGSGVEIGQFSFLFHFRIAGNFEVGQAFRVDVGFFILGKILFTTRGGFKIV